MRRMLLRGLTLPFLLTACGGAMEPEAKLEQETASVAPMRVWTQLAPGVWERPNEHGGYDRTASGVEGLEFVLQKVRMERVLLSLWRTENAGAAGLDKRLSANEELLRALEKEVLQARASGAPSPEPASATRPETHMGKHVGMICGTAYYFAVQFTYAPIGSSVRTIAESHPSSPSPYTRTLYSYAEAESDTPHNLQTDTDTSPPLVSASYHFQVSQAGVDYTPYPTYMMGRALVTAGGGCTDPSGFYEVTNW